jgi:hypothetical protein
MPRHALGSDDDPGSAARDPLQADCGACRGLCCVLLPFDADQGFAFDKAAGAPCSHLTADFRCGIHADLVSRGFPGCSRYDCHGAGQYVTASLGLDARWYESAALVSEAYTLFAATRALHARLKARRESEAAERPREG